MPTTIRNQEKGSNKKCWVTAQYAANLKQVLALLKQNNVQKVKRYRSPDETGVHINNWKIVPRQ